MQFNDEFSFSTIIVDSGSGQHGNFLTTDGKIVT